MHLSEHLHVGLDAVAGSQPLLLSSSGRAASVAIIIRVRPTTATSPPQHHSPTTTAQQQSPQSSLATFFAQPWVYTGVPEIFYIKRSSRPSDRWSAHIAFPGGRAEPDDESSLYTAMRETEEEVGIDLAERDFMYIGQLDDREVTTSLGKRLLMILSAHVFLCTSPHIPFVELQPSEVASAYWIPINLLYSPQVRWGNVSIDVTSRIAPASPAARWIIRRLIGPMHFYSILLPNRPFASIVRQQRSDDSSSYSSSLSSSSISSTSSHNHSPSIPTDLNLWGLTLGVSLDLIAYMNPPEPTYTQYHSTATSSLLSQPYSSAYLQPSTPSTHHPNNHQNINKPLTFDDPIFASSPGMTSILPRFTHTDISVWLWLFGFRYRRLLRRWAEHHNHNFNSHQDRRVNWAGVALAHYYSALRRALVVTVVFRSTSIIITVLTIITWLRKRYRLKRAI